MNDQPNSDENKRDGYRCPSPEPRKAKLTIHMGGARNVSHDVVVIDESVGGFGILIDGAANLGPTRCGILELDDKEVICDIINVRRCQNGEMRLGLQLIEEFEEDPAKTTRLSSVGPANEVKMFGNFGPLLLAIGIMVFSLIAFICYESTKDYIDKSGRQQKGSVATAFKKIGSWFGGNGTEQN